MVNTQTTQVTSDLRKLDTTFDEKGFSVDARDGRVFRYYSPSEELTILQVLKNTIYALSRLDSESDSRDLRRPETIHLKRELDYIIPMYTKNRWENNELDSNPKPLSLQDILLAFSANSVIELSGNKGARDDKLSIVCKYNPKDDSLIALGFHQNEKPTLVTDLLIEQYLGKASQKRKLELAQNVCERAVQELDLKAAYREYVSQFSAKLDPAVQTLLHYQ